MLLPKDLATDNIDMRKVYNFIAELLPDGEHIVADPEKLLYDASSYNVAKLRRRVGVSRQASKESHVPQSSDADHLVRIASLTDRFVQTFTQAVQDFQTAMRTEIAQANRQSGGKPTKKKSKSKTKKKPGGQKKSKTKRTHTSNKRKK